MLRKAIYLLVLIGFMTVLPITALAANRPQNIILVGWDGAQRDQVNECLSRNELPNLQKLIDQGKYVQIDIEGQTDTKAAWTQILTGYNPEDTGVYSNSKYQPIPKGLSIFERLEMHFGPSDFVTVAVIGNKTHVGEINPPRKIRLTQKGSKEAKGKIVEEGGVKYQLIPGSPYYNMYTALEAWEFGLMQDKKVGTRAIELLEKYKVKPFFFFVNFAEVDKAGNPAGENSKKYNNTLISNDYWTGKIIEKVNQLGLGDKTQIYVTSEHGSNQDNENQNYTPYVFLATNNKNVSRDGRGQDVAPTIMEAFGLNVSELEPPLDGISLTKPDTRPPVTNHLLQNPQKVIEELKPGRTPDVIYVPTPQEVVDKMLELAQVTKDDIVYDLGCGDGRIVVTAAKRFGCRALGFDIDPNRVKESLENVEKNNVGHLVTIEQKDIFTLDLSPANIITLYLLPSLNVKLIPQLEKLKPGSRIVSHDFDMKGVKPDKVVSLVISHDQSSHKIYFWTTPLNKE